MKHFASLYQLRRGLVGSLLGLFFAGSFYLASAPVPGSKRALMSAVQEKEGEDDGGADGDRVYADHPDWALEQDLARTRDPATGTVPRERLLAAARYNQAKLAGQAQHRTAAGVLASAAWTERGPSNVGGRILALLVDGTDATGNTLWAGSAGGGLWKGTNATTSTVQWQNINSFLTNLAVTTVAATPGISPQVLYCGTGEGYFNVDAIRGAGIWKSSDGGATWAQLAATNNANFYYVQKIVVHPVTKDIYAATRAGLWRSQDAGTSWSLVLGLGSTPASATNRVADLEIGADNTLYAAFGIFATDGIYRSTTGNAGSWTNLNTLAGSGLPAPTASPAYQRIELACAPSDPNRLYALFQASGTNALLDIYRSMDRGTTWAAMARPGASPSNRTFDFTNGQAWYNLVAAVSPADPNALYVGGLDLWFTSDGGNTTPTSIVWDHESAWNLAPTSPYFVHADQHAIAFVPTATAPANLAYFGSDGGVSFSANASISNSSSPTFASKNNGLNVTQFYALALHPTSYNYFLAGAQDNGTQQFAAGAISATTEVTGGDGGFCAIDQSAPATQFSSYVYNQYFRSTDGGSSFTQFFLSGTTGSFINPMDYDSRAKVLYAGNSADTYLAWTNASTASSAAAATTITPSLGTGAGTVTHVTVSPLTANRLYVGTDAGVVLRVDNANTVTPAITTLRTSASRISVSCVAIDPANEQHLLVTYSNYGVVSVYETTNAAAAVPTWTSVEGALPDMPVRWALFDPRSPARALLATEMGVYATDQLNGVGTVWSPASSGLANTRVDMLRYRPGDKLVAAATHGRGLFTSAVFSTTPLPVTLLHFTAALAPGGVALRWQTATELNSRSFVVERSADAVNFQPLGSVAAAGTTSTPRAYAYTDATAVEGLYYYRLHQIDRDATGTYSPVVAVQVPAHAGALLSDVYPNPFSSQLTLQLGLVPGGDVTTFLTDASGRRVFAATQRPAARQLTLMLPASLAPGSYVLTVRSNGQQSRRRVVRQ
ncbi:MAG: hypothetical protein NVS3B25_26100 [Hymenobacter sp.]